MENTFDWTDVNFDWDKLDPYTRIGRFIFTEANNNALVYTLESEAQNQELQKTENTYFIVDFDTKNVSDITEVVKTDGEDTVRKIEFLESELAGIKALLAAMKK